MDDFKNLIIALALVLVLIFVVVLIIVKKKNNTQASYFAPSKDKKSTTKKTVSVQIDENVHPEITPIILRDTKSVIKLFEGSFGCTSAEVIKKVRKYFAEVLNDADGGYPENTDKFFQVYRMMLFGEPRHVVYLEFDPDSDPEVVQRVLIYLDKNFADRYRGALVKMFGVSDDKNSIREKGAYNVFRYEFYKDGKYRLTFTESETYGGCSLMIEPRTTEFDIKNIKTDFNEAN